MVRGSLIRRYLHALIEDVSCNGLQLNIALCWNEELRTVLRTAGIDPCFACKYSCVLITRIVYVRQGLLLVSLTFPCRSDACKQGGRAVRRAGQ